MDQLVDDYKLAEIAGKVEKLFVEGEAVPQGYRRLGDPQAHPGGPVASGPSACSNLRGRGEMNTLSNNCST